MRRNKTWWAALTTEERRELVKLEGAWLVTRFFQCRICGIRTWYAVGSLCGKHKTRRQELIAKAEAGVQDAKLSA